MKNNDTIVALATAPFNCAIHIIRISGKNAFKITSKIVQQKIIKKGYSCQKASIISNNKLIDEVILIKFVQPYSYTGEDTIEINCHGGIYIAKKIINLLIENGATLAQRGQFTKWALINGKINVLQALAVKNVINSTNDTSLLIANNALKNELTKKIEHIRKVIFNILGNIEINIDYPEYIDYEEITNKLIIKNLSSIIKTIKILINNSQIAEKINNGIKVAIIGQPNVGKSSLLNLMLDEDKAIISKIPGTTRDIVEGQINYKGLLLNLIDTAGIRKTNNEIEQIGVQKSNKQLLAADVVIFVTDISKKWSKNEKKIVTLLKNKLHFIIYNKNDLPNIKKITNGIAFNTLNGKRNIILDKIIKIINLKNLNKSNFIVFQDEYQINILIKVHNNLKRAIEQAQKNMPMDLIVNYIHQSLVLIDEILGKNKNPSYIDELFKNFCIGK